ncbi:hypothetical protein H7U35_05705 [Mediterranea massiliensis]|uniref:Acyl-coenzyme A:6-aminopenicillanic acid acyl-transferase n=1 Tax=Mediterranea massiliensis TaxID=1841865 RepID=A0ABS2DZB0_9BACT|nr:hypothetical protein [Mediterranea massiliensis]MBM6734713.1 hypothetical protein [Mediterranea massiliensis]
MKNILLLTALLAAWLTPALACTSAVVSGRATPDGRPLLWKHRDTDFLQNHVEYVRGEKYDFIAVVNSADFRQKREAWIGTNSAGFALMNTQSYNLVDVKDDEERGAANGRVIYRALEVCATVDDFRHFLDTIAKPSLIEANFGAIDAQGGAMMFEVDYYTYKIYDANDPATAPDGYVARTNFSQSGQYGPGAGVVRYQEAVRVLDPLAHAQAVTPRHIFDDLSRSFHNCVLGIDLKEASFTDADASGWFVDQDFIPRSSSSCSVVVQGVKKGESATLTTMWTVLGYAPTGVAVPLWVDSELPRMVCMDDGLGTSPLSYGSLSLKDRVFSLKWGMGSDRYLHWSLLYNAQGSGYMQQLAPYEAENFEQAERALESWRRQNRVDRQEMKALYRRLDNSSLWKQYKEWLEE